MNLDDLLCIDRHFLGRLKWHRDRDFRRQIGHDADGIYDGLGVSLPSRVLHDNTIAVLFNRS